ncbi:hypothetical protein Patl1_36154 [Pistacia atlantica]|nr:hypothetical protein Patl1_36154 [Pistacia atlantica]
MKWSFQPSLFLSLNLIIKKTPPHLFLNSHHSCFWRCWSESQAMAITSRKERDNTCLPKPVKKDRSLKDRKMVTGKEVICIYAGNSKCQKRKRATHASSYINEEVKSSVMEKATDVQSNLAPQFPSFIKCMLRSHVSGGFWLGLPRYFCINHLPKQDTMMVLEDESSKEYETKYLAEKVGLSAGWRGFSIAHKLVERDVLVFHLVGPSKFKVYIVRSSGSDEVDGALGLLELETCYSRRDSVTFKKKGYAEKDINLCKEKEDDNYWEPQPLAQAIPQVNSEKHEPDDWLAAGMISETINIADAIRASKITTSESFLQTRLDQLMNLASEPKRSKQARLERAEAEEEKRILEMKLLEVRETIKKLDAKIETLGVNTDSLQVKFQEVATAPW